ncbi:hypothetical protein B0H67DRAFT_557075 [Lasiosphaeris hirsuta]|uniref:Uncharacterized protein n=1 Tax=Lasiosphaeris hirsuta TaxID=260670 RepID=A0AA40A3L0_9PEZI|nr:hypothetical protein B0H67DRAFT_557075 [Lasiosphaeris hirsuta]
MKTHSVLRLRTRPRDQLLPGDTAHVLSPSRRPSVRDSIGIARLCILVLGTAAIIIATVLLGLLWQGAATAIGQGDPGQNWRHVIDRGWAPVTVTLCAAAIRTAVSLQAGVAISMIASVLLEKQYVKLGDSAFLSTIRAVSIQPVNLLVFGGRSILQSLGLLGVPLLAITSLLAIASTFTSSILLSDFGNINILGDFNTSVIGYGNESVKTTMDIWRSPPVQYARFAEYTDEKSRATGPYIDDTGMTLRAPLPMAAGADRETLREYAGPANVFDHRVACVAPKDLWIVSINETRASSGNSVGPLSFGGYATFDTHLPLPLLGAEPGKRIPFNCVIPSVVPTAGLRSNMTVCVVTPPPSTEESASPLRLSPFLPLKTNLTFYIPPIFFIFNVTAPVRSNGMQWADFANEYFGGDSDDTKGFDIPQSALLTAREGPWTWTRVDGVELLQGVVFSASACVTVQQGFAFNVTLSSSSAKSSAPEPTLGWTGALVSGTAPDSTPEFIYDTSAVRRQLAATADWADIDRPQRGVMELSFAATNWSHPLDPDPSFVLIAPDLFPVLQTTPLCALACRTDPSAVMAVGEDNDIGHPVHVALFHDALAATRSPARALQSWLTTLTRQRFYDGLGRFTTGAEARHARSVAVFAPRQWAGFVGVVAMLACHFVVVVGVAVCWQAVSQVVSDATLPLLQRASNLNDADVKAIIREEMGEGGSFMGNGKGDGTEFTVFTMPLAAGCRAFWSHLGSLVSAVLTAALADVPRGTPPEVLFGSPLEFALIPLEYFDRLRHQALTLPVYIPLSHFR